MYMYFFIIIWTQTCLLLYQIIQYLKKCCESGAGQQWVNLMRTTHGASLGARAHHAEGGRAAALCHSTPDTQEAHNKTIMYRLHGKLFLFKLSILTYIDRQAANNLQTLQ